jgi:2-methylaconitate cis-trans-isomerase PrpF
VTYGGRRAAAASALIHFSDEANLDEGAMWPTSFALKELSAAEEAKISALVKRAGS